VAATKKTQTQKGKKKGKKPVAAGIAVVNHPKATRSINLLKSYAGLAAFAFSGYVSWKAGNQFADVAASALLWGVSVYVAVWAMAVQVWRHVAIAEVRAAERRWREQKNAEQDQVEKLRKVLEENGMPSEDAGAMPVS
jgi:hypothetical protein